MNTPTPQRPPGRGVAYGTKRRSGVSWVLLAVAIPAAVAATYAAIALTTALAAHAAAAGPLAVDSLDQVITNLRDVIVGLLVGLATLFLTIGGVRYILAGGDPSEVEAAKKTLKFAAVGYGIAVLAPAFVQMLQHIVGAS